MGMTIIEKILSRASGRDRTGPGDLVVVDVDTAVIIDANFFATVRREIVKIDRPERVAVVYDHVTPAPDQAAAEAQRYGREFVKTFGITRFHDVGPHQGISHAVVADMGYALPGSVLVCSDSHTCASGAFNAAARGIGYPDMVYVLTTGKTWFQVGTTARYNLTGELQKGVSAKDVFLYIADVFGDHAGQNIEFGGPGIAGLNMNARRTLATMGAELSAEFVTFEADDRLIAYMKERTDKPFNPAAPDADANYSSCQTIDLSRLEPLVALPDTVIRNSRPISQVAGEKIDQAFIGSCANGTLDDFAEAARVVAGKHVAPGVRFLVTPSSQAVLRAASTAGYLDTLLQAGAIVTPSTCGACFGGHMGVLGPNETCITASTRNFKGRMGDKSARIFMASPATVAASAIAGHIAHPADVM